MTPNGSVAASALLFRARELNVRELPKVDAHLHTTWTDGKQSVVQAYETAAAGGLSAMLFSEHSRKTSSDWFPNFAAQVRLLSKEPCHAFVGTEVKIEALDGSIDTSPTIRGLCDLVIASVHRFPDASGGSVPFASVNPAEAVEREFELSWAVLGNPDVDILGHMFGMCYRRYGVTPPSEKLRLLIRRAAETGVAIELNARYHAEPAQMLDWCKEFDAKVSFGSDAHDSAGIGAMTRLLDSIYL